LSFIIELSHCDQFAHEQFRHAADDIYIEQRVLNSINEYIRAYERDIIGDAELVELIEKEAGVALSGPTRKPDPTRPEPGQDPASGAHGLKSIPGGLIRS